MSKKKWIVLGVIAAISIVLIGAAVWVHFLPYRTNKIDWDMHGYLVTADGEVKEELELSVKGKVRDYKDREETDQLKLNFALPDSVPSQLRWADNQKCFLSDFQRSFDTPYYACYAFAYPVPIGKDLCVFALDPVQKYVIIKWVDESGQLLVASSNPAVSAQEILKHFQTFLDFYAFDR